MFRLFAAGLFKLAGWKLTGPLPRHLPKFVLAVAPHTTYVDFFVGVGARAAVDVWIVYMSKAELFRPAVVGWFMKLLGGYPVDRSRSTNLVDAVVQVFNEKEKFAVCIAPEGTRADVPELKTGFYYMALGAGVPIVMCGFDYPVKEVRFSEPFYPTGDWETDKITMARFVADLHMPPKTWVKQYLGTQSE